jgi:hypothetical protein
VVAEDGVVEEAGLETGAVAGPDVWLDGVCVRVGDAFADRDGLGDGDDGRAVDGVTAGMADLGTLLWTVGVGALQE